MTAKIRAQLPKGFSRLFRVRGFVRRGLEPSFAATFARAMPVRIRLARYEHRNLPFYRIYVADSRAPRDGRHIEIIGHYDPKPGASPSLRPRRSRLGRRARDRTPPCTRLTSPSTASPTIDRDRREQTHGLEDRPCQVRPLPPPLLRSRRRVVRSFVSDLFAKRTSTHLEHARRRARRYWLSVGAQPSDTVARLFGQAGIIPAPPRKGVGARKAPWTRGFAASAAR